VDRYAYGIFEFSCILCGHDGGYEETLDRAAVKAGLNPDHIHSEIKTSDHGSKVIVDDVLLYAINAPTLFKFIAIVLDTMIHYRVTITLKKCHFLPSQLEFVGINVVDCLCFQKQ
jgi:hypothetical protein